MPYDFSSPTENHKNYETKCKTSTSTNTVTAQKIKFSIKDFFSKCYQIGRAGKKCEVDSASKLQEQSGFILSRNLCLTLFC